MSVLETGWLTAGVLATLVVVLAAAWLAYARAVRVDRLHRQVLGARATLEAQLTLRAQAAAELAGCGALDAASALLLAQAAHDALEAEGPLVDDGLDPRSRAGDGHASQDLAGDGHSTAGQVTAVDTTAQVTARAVAESDLSRVIRAVLPQDVRTELVEDPISQAAVERMERTAYRVQLARAFHNTHVAEARRLRMLASVRLLHLAGRAPMPQTVDIDDDIRPHGAAGSVPDVGGQS